MNHAILVGINAYPFPNVLHGCLDDVSDISKELQSQYQFSPTEIITITDAEATASKIKASLSAAVAKLKSGDKFILWYSGHGAQLTEGDIGTDVICPVDFDFTPETSVTVDDFHNIFSKIPNGVVAAWGSDSCHSGDLEKDFYRLGAPKQFYSARPQKPVKTVRSFKDVSSALPNISLVAGCQSSQTSADAYINDRYNGAFTYFFLEQLRSPGGVTEPLQKLVAQTTTALHDAGYTQSPQLTGHADSIGKAFLHN
ncbi:caspase family protein [Paraburkholderia sp. HD33-4]|uniref:caspase family protein n=1 Tax=Paraburkholderia sp. HD33-4 TaxID=2883242 RepID=UPI001F321EC4|nr:caspase family protein [Paraburkholderia sp. HD33-4]